MATLSLDNGEIVRAVLLQAGLGRTASDMDAATEADVRAIVRSGLRRFYFPVQNGFTYTWRFLETAFTVSAEAVFDDGTLTVSGGTATLSGGTWPDDITDHYIDVDGHILFVSERTDDTNVEVTHSQVSVDAGTTYEAPRFRYDLPSNFGEFIGGVVYQNESKNYLLVASSEPELRLRYAIGHNLDSDSSHYAIFNKQIYLWPTPEKEAFIQGVYIAVPDDNLPADLTTPGSVAQVDPIYAEAVMEAILAAAESFNDDTAGIHEQRFQAALQSAISHDRITGAAYDFSHRAVDRTYRGLGPVGLIDFEPE